jgi:hypothetical protein
MSAQANVRPLRRPGGDEASPNRRWKTQWPGELVSAAGRADCTVLDISSCGAQLALDQPPQAGESVSLLLETIGTIAAEVMWRREDRVGLQFSEQQAWLRRLNSQYAEPDAPAASRPPRG